MTIKKIAVITGGTSGIGLEVARALSSHPTSPWQVYILGSNEERGRDATTRHLPGSIFMKADIKNYAELTAAFRTIYETNKRVDFVFANAGSGETCDFLAPSEPAEADGDISPPPPNMAVIDVNLTGTMHTCYLALHYFRLSKGVDKRSQKNLVLTGSCLSFYGSRIPLYTATKHALIGFMHSIAPPCQREGVRVNMICPGIVRTNITADWIFDTVAPELFVSMEHLVQTVLHMLEGRDITDSNGVQVSGSELWNRAIEMTGGDKFYFRESLQPSDKVMERVMTESFLRIV